VFGRRKRPADDSRTEPKPDDKATARTSTARSQDKPKALPPAEPSEASASSRGQKTKTIRTSEAPVKREDLQNAPGQGGTTGALLGRGSRFKGVLTFDGTVVIEGEFIGDIQSEGHLEVGKDAKVDGTIQVKSAVISGEVGGTITTSGELELKASARVSGDLDVKSLVVERGATFDGSVKMRGSSRAPRRGATPGLGSPGEAPPIVAPPHG